MRERHKQRFVEATAELRLRHRAMAKRVRALEMQLLKNSVRLLYSFMKSWLVSFMLHVIRILYQH